MNMKYPNIASNAIDGLSSQAYEAISSPKYDTAIRHMINQVRQANSNLCEILSKTNEHCYRICGDGFWIENKNEQVSVDSITICDIGDMNQELVKLTENVSHLYGLLDKLGQL